MPSRFKHANIIAQDPDRLARFYSEVLECPRVVDRHSDAPWLGRAMGLPGVALHIVHVRLPGCQASGPHPGPTLEIIGLDDIEDVPKRTPRTVGLMHTAFVVEDLRATLARLLAAGGELVGEVAETGTGVTLVYARDPEGNIVELQEETAAPASL